MPTITSIKSQKNKNRVNVYLDNKFGFGIDLDNFVLLHLKIDQELSEDEVEKIKGKADFQKTWEKVLRFAMARPRSEKEIKDYFRRKNIDALMHNNLLKKLRHLELLNDLEFTKWWVEQRLLKKKSLRIMNYELRIKGIDQNTIEDVLSKTEVDEEKMAKELVAKKMYKWEKLELKIRKQKISQYLAGKGFSWEVIEKVI